MDNNQGIHPGDNINNSAPQDNQTPKKDISSEKDKKQFDYEKLILDYDVVQKKAKEYLEGWQRSRADYLNLKKETEKRLGEIGAMAQITLLVNILPIFDNFEKALQYIPQDVSQSDWAKGLYQVQKQFHDLIRQVGFERIKTVGEKFNPKFHEAVAHEKRDGCVSDMIFEEVQGGWMYKGETFIAAKVKVGK